MRRTREPSESPLLVDLLLSAAVVVCTAAAAVAVVSRRRTLAAWRQRLAMLARDVRLLRARGGDDVRPAAASASSTVLSLAAERVGLGLVPSPDRRRRRHQAAVDRAADQLLARLRRMARDIDPEHEPPTGWGTRSDREPRHAQCDRADAG